MSKYDSIINLEHHRSLNRKRMSNHDRAAQFMPFQALSTFSPNIDEAKRRTDSKIELTDEAQMVIKNKLDFIIKNLEEYGFVNIKYFEKDKKKDGGFIITKDGIIKRIDEVNRKVYFSDGLIIEIDDIIDINSDIIYQNFDFF